MDTPEKHVQLSLLLVDDDKELCGMMKEFFAGAGHRLDCEYDGRRGLASAASGTYDLVILDVMLPIIDGFSVLRQLRRRKDVPVILLTARIQHQDRILGLNAGARIRAVLRRTDATKGSKDVTIGDIRINATKREVWIAGSPAELTEMEFDLLEMLMRSAGRVVSRDELTLALFERKAAPYDRILDVHISHLRKKLEGGRSLIRTIRGVGYVFARAA